MVHAMGTAARRKAGRIPAPVPAGRRQAARGAVLASHPGPEALREGRRMRSGPGARGRGSPCPGRCKEYAAPQRWGMGVCRCSHCQVFLKWDGLRCPCCRYRTTLKRRNSPQNEVPCSKCGRPSRDSVCTPCRRLKEKAPGPGRCVICGSAMDVTHGKLYCSSRCRSMRHGHECAECGRAYKGHIRQAYCSRTCAARANGRIRARPQDPRSCATCGREFLGRARKYCSDDCYRRNAAGRCARCGAAFAGIVGKKYCSPGCKMEYQLHGAAPGVAV